MKKIGILLAMIFVFSIGLAFAQEADPSIEVNITSNNVAPVATSLVNNITGNANPGETYEWVLTVEDDNGFEDIDTAQLICWSVEESAIGESDDWDHYTVTDYVRANISSTESTFTFEIDFSVHARDKEWNCEAEVWDQEAENDTIGDVFTMNARIGILLSDYSVAMAGNPGAEIQLFNPNTITHDGNVEYNITVEGTNLTGVTDGSWEIPVTALKYNDADVVGDAVALQETPVGILSNWDRGTYDIASTSGQYWWINIPLPLKAQVYSGTITYTASAA